MKTKNVTSIGGISRNLLAATALLAMPAFAQNIGLVRTGNTEVGGFFGASYGLDHWRGMGGGNVAYAATRFILPYVEYSYFPGIIREGSINLPGFGTTTFQTSIPLSDFHGGVHVRFPRGQTPVMPYLALGAGVISYRDTTATNINIPGLGPVPDQRIDGVNAFAVNFGGGIRYYTTERLGFRAEFKGYKPRGTSAVSGSVDSGAPFYKLTVGIFFQIH